MSEEECSECGEPTGRAGLLDDSITLIDVETGHPGGVLCEECRDILLKTGKWIDENDL